MHALIEELRDTERNSRGPVIERIAQELSEEGWSTLSDMVVDHAINEDLRAAIAECLGRSGRDELVSQLFEMLKSEEAILRTAACYGLSVVRTQESVERLIGALGDRVNTVRNGAERSLLLMPEALSTWGMNLLLDLLQHPVALSRSPAARLLGVTEDRRALEPLLAMLETDSDWLGRMWAAHGLGELEFEEAFDALARIARQDPKNRVRAACAESLGKLRHERSAEVLGELVNDEDEGVRKSAREALQALGFGGDAEEYDPFAE